MQELLPKTLLLNKIRVFLFEILIWKRYTWKLRSIIHVCESIIGEDTIKAALDIIMNAVDFLKVKDPKRYEEIVHSISWFRQGLTSSLSLHLLVCAEEEACTASTMEEFKNQIICPSSKPIS